VSVERLGPDDLGAVTALVQRAVDDPPSAEELRGALAAPDQPATVLGDPAVGVVATVESGDAAHVRLLAVDPSARGRGHGHALLAAAEEWAREAGHARLTVGADPPYFLWPGVPSTSTAALCLLERRRYVRGEANFDMDVDLAAIPPDPGGHALATPAERPEVDAFMADHWANWRPEVLRALDKGNLVVRRDDAGAIAAFCAFEVNRAGRLGPVAVRPDLLGRGEGRPALLGALHELRRRGRRTVAVVWVGPVAPYAAVGGVVGSVYFVYRRALD